jgi:hypothetical protein
LKLSDNEYVDALEKDEAAFQAELPKLTADAGKYALVYEEKLVGGVC